MSLIPDPSLATAVTVSVCAALTPALTVCLLKDSDVKTVSPFWVSGCAAGVRNESIARAPTAAAAVERIRMFLRKR